MDKETKQKIKRLAVQAEPKIIQFLANLLSFTINLIRTIVSEVWNEVFGR